MLNIHHSPAGNAYSVYTVLIIKGINISALTGFRNRFLYAYAVAKV